MRSARARSRRGASNLRLPLSAVCRLPMSDRRVVRRCVPTVQSAAAERQRQRRRLWLRRQHRSGVFSAFAPPIVSSLFFASCVFQWHLTSGGQQVRVLFALFLRKSLADRDVFAAIGKQGVAVADSVRRLHNSHSKNVYAVHVKLHVT